MRGQAMLGWRFFKVHAIAFALAMDGIATYGQFANKPNSSEPLEDPNLQFAGAPSLIEKIMPSIVTIRVKDRDGRQLSIGTGFVVDSSGLIATNYHVLTEGREFTVERSPKSNLKVIAVEAFDITGDYAIIRVDPQSESLPALTMGSDEDTKPGVPVLAFGHPLGLEHSVVRGMISAIRDVDSRKLIQVAMPVEPGNSGGPLVDEKGRVLGIVNIKALRADNVGFAVPISGIQALIKQPSPIRYQQWAGSPSLDEEQWRPVFGATWQERSGVMTARGLGTGFGGRSLCLKRVEPPKMPYELSVFVKLNDERGAAGLVFHSDGGDRHYGFYPSNGNLRLTCFQGPSVERWEIIQEVHSTHYTPDSWNELKVLVERDHVKCLVNGHIVIESNSIQLDNGSVGLAKFRDTVAEFKRFRIAKHIELHALADNDRSLFEELTRDRAKWAAISDEQVSLLAKSSDSISRSLKNRSEELKEEYQRLSRLSDDISILPALQELNSLLQTEEPEDMFRGSLWIAALDNPDLDRESYIRKIEKMSQQIAISLPSDASQRERLAAINRFLFDENGFHGSRQEYYHAANSHMDRVIDDREGLPITLSILYIELARRNQIELKGIGLPGHFVVCYQNEEGDSQYIDVFNRGAPLSRKDAEKMIRELNQRNATVQDLLPQTTREVLLRVLRNLISSAQRDRNEESIVKYCSAMVAIAPEVPQYRMMRCAARYRTQRLAGALSDIETLLATSPSEFSTSDLLQMKAKIQSEQGGR
jgi:serine protease Do